MKYFLRYVGMFVVVFLYIFGNSSQDVKSQDYEQIADKITERTARKLKKEKGLILIGTGGQMMNDIQMMMMGFHFYKEVDIDTARVLLVESVQEYLTAINSDEEIRPYLHDYPFTAQNVEIEIYFYEPDHSDIPEGKITIASTSDDKIVYYIHSPETHRLTRFYEETFQDALKAIH